MKPEIIGCAFSVAIIVTINGIGVSSTNPIKGLLHLLSYDYFWKGRNRSLALSRLRIIRRKKPCLVSSFSQPMPWKNNGKNKNKKHRVAWHYIPAEYSIGLRYMHTFFLCF